MDTEIAKELDKNDMIKEVLDKFEAKGLEITHANYGGHKKPEEVGDCRPDVVALDTENELYHIATAAYPENLKDDGTERKIRVLSNLMMKEGRSSQIRIPFYLAIPKGQLEKVEDILDEKKIARANVLPIECR